MPATQRHAAKAVAAVSTQSPSDVGDASVSPTPEPTKPASQSFARKALVFAMFAAGMLAPRYARRGLQRLDLLGYGAYVGRRPALVTHEERQMLVLGTMGAGTTATTYGLQEAFGLEVGHESSDSSSEYVRDGTVSWAHALRFLPPAGRPRFLESGLRSVCDSAPEPYLLHPTMFSPSNKCDYALMLRGGWDACWAAECRATLGDQHSCARRPEGEGGKGGHACGKFRRAVLQVRHPLDVAASLLCMFCPEQGAANDDNGDGKHLRLHPRAGGDCGGLTSNSEKKGQNPGQAGLRSAPRQMLRALWPDAGWRDSEESKMGEKSEAGPGKQSCAEMAARYWLAYHRSVLPFVGTPPRVYKVESNDLCALAKLGGWDGPEQLAGRGEAAGGANSRTRAAVRAACGGRSSADAGGDAEQTRRRGPRSNRGKLQLRWRDLGPAALVAEVQAMARQLGYKLTAEEEAEVGGDPDPNAEPKTKKKRRAKRLD